MRVILIMGDCLGNHMKDAGECDTTTVTRARVFVDSLSNTSLNSR